LVQFYEKRTSHDPFLSHRLDERVVCRNPLEDVVSELYGPTQDVFLRRLDGIHVYPATLSTLLAFEAIRM
jgi:hypothetical protein